MNLLPCPFCGGPAVLCADGSTPDLPHFVRCDNLLCCGFNTSNGVRTPEIAAKATEKQISLAPVHPAYTNPILNPGSYRWITAEYEWWAAIGNNNPDSFEWAAEIDLNNPVGAAQGEDVPF